MSVPARYARSTFDAYRPQTPSQAEAADAARAFALAVRAHHGHKGGLFRRRPPLPGKGLYLVGPVGTGKTHLLAAAYHALAPAVPCAFMSASALFRSTEPPDRFAGSLARRARVLCLDEVELDDPANEARLILTLRALDGLGVVLFATSNVEPDKFLSATFGGDRFRRFLSEFHLGYRVVVVGGDDYRARLSKPGRAWIGPAARTRPAMAADHAEHGGLWLTFADFVDRSRETPHPDLVRALGATPRLYLEGVAPRGTDDALRLLRVLDDLYLLPDAPVLHFTSEAFPEAWLNAGNTRGVLERGIAEKFRRTVSRIRALCAVDDLRGTTGV